MKKDYSEPDIAQDWTAGPGKQLFVAIDHGLTFANIKGLEKPFQLLGLLSEIVGVDGIIASAGLYRQAKKKHISLDHMVRLLTVDYVCFGKNGIHETLTERSIIIHPDEAALYHPNGYKMFFNIYDDNRALIDNVRDFTAFASAGKRLGIPALAEVMFFNNAQFLEPDKQADELLRGCRIAMESGADALKIPLIHDINAIGEMIDRIGLPTYILGGGSNQEVFLNKLRPSRRFPSGV
jgi:fructose-bisphosphate aldolase, class I